MITGILQIEESPDGSGDGILTFPPELIEAWGILPGQIIKMTVEDGVLLLRKSNENAQTE